MVARAVAGAGDAASAAAGAAVAAFLELGVGGRRRLRSQAVPLGVMLGVVRSWLLCVVAAARTGPGDPRASFALGGRAKGLEVTASLDGALAMGDPVPRDDGEEDRGEEGEVGCGEVVRLVEAQLALLAVI